MGISKIIKIVFITRIRNKMKMKSKVWTDNLQYQQEAVLSIMILEILKIYNNIQREFKLKIIWLKLMMIYKI